MGTQTQQFERELEKVDEDKGNFVNPENANAIKHMAKAYHEDNVIIDAPEGEQTNAVSTLENYVQKCRRFAYDVDLMDTTEIELNELLQQFKDGSHPGVKDNGLTNGSLRLYSIGLRKFYKVHSNGGIDPDEIPVLTL